MNCSAILRSRFHIFALIALSATTIFLEVKLGNIVAKSLQTEITDFRDALPKGKVEDIPTEIPGRRIVGVHSVAYSGKVYVALFLAPPSEEAGDEICQMSLAPLDLTLNIQFLSKELEKLYPCSSQDGYPVSRPPIFEEYRILRRESTGDRVIKIVRPKNEVQPSSIKDVCGTPERTMTSESPSKTYSTSVKLKAENNDVAGTDHVVLSIRETPTNNDEFHAPKHRATISSASSREELLARLTSNLLHKLRHLKKPGVPDAQSMTLIGYRTPPRIIIVDHPTFYLTTIGQMKLGPAERFDDTATIAESERAAAYAALRNWLASSFPKHNKIQGSELQALSQKG